MAGNLPRHRRDAAERKKLRLAKRQAAAKQRQKIRATKGKRPLSTGDPIPRLYPNGWGVVMATGPTLTKEQIEYIRPFHELGIIHTFGCNDVYKWCDFLDVFYACDPRWFQKNEDCFDYQCAQKWTQDVNVAKKTYAKHGIKHVMGGGGKGLDYTPNRIHFGSNSGFQVLNLAWHFGIRKFILLGYTMQTPGGMEQHFFGPHPKGLNQNKNSYKGFVGQFGQIEARHRAMITNCTPQSLLSPKVFKFVPLEEELPLSLLDEAKTQHGSRRLNKTPTYPSAGSGPY